MIDARKKVVDCCERLAEKAKSAGVSGGIAEDVTVIAASARERQLVVPIVGAFSAGKSTLINNLLGESVLPVDIRPETSLATELHYSPENYILAVKDSGETDRYKIDEIKAVTENASKYLYAQLFLNNENLRQIEPLVLVDMPGFDSPLDSHNKAIGVYLDRGCYYIVLSSAEEGTITKTLERRLEEIAGLKRDFSLFLSKANLRPEDSLEELAAHFQGQLEDKFGSGKKVASFGQSAEEVTKCLKSIDKNTIFLKLYRDTLWVACENIIANINLRINSSKKDAENLRTAIDEMEKAVEKLKAKMGSDIDDMHRRYSGAFVNDIVTDAGKALERSLDELCGVAVSGNRESLERLLNEVVRSALTSSIREKIDGINKQITVDFSESLQDLDKIMKNLDLDENYLKNITGKVESALKILDDVLVKKTFARAALRTAGAGVALTGKTAVGIGVGVKAAAGAGLAASVVNPIIGIAIIFLPEIISGLITMLGGDQKEKMKEAVRSKFSGEVFPSIKRKLRDEIPAVLQDSITTMIQNVQEQFEEQIKNQEEAIKTQMEQENTNIAEKEAARKKLEDIRSDVQSITSEIIEWGE